MPPSETDFRQPMRESAAIDALTNQFVGNFEPGDGSPRPEAPARKAPPTVEAAIAQDGPSKQDQEGPAEDEAGAEPLEEGSEERESEGAEEEGQEELVEVRVDGRTERVTFEELKNGYSREADYRHKTQDLAEQRRRVERDDTERRETWRRRMQEVDHVLRFALETDPLVAELKGLDLVKLAKDDPARYVEVTAGLNARKAAYEDWTKTTDKAVREQAERYAMDEHRKLIDAMPELADATKAKAKARELGEYLAGEGFSEVEIGSARDHRLLVMASKAMLYDRMSKERPLAAKKVQALPKVTRPGAGRTRPSESQSVLNARERFNKTRSEADAIAMIEQQLVGSRR